jgi:hydroxymethylbilane synthase
VETIRIVRIATRGSQLALWQAHHVRDRLRALEPDLAVELLVLKTRGDKILDRALSEVGGKGLFVKEIEEALLDGRADVAVHSMKDLPAELASGLELAAVPEREDPRDALVVRPGLSAKSVSDLPVGARVGTSSLRRVCQLRALRPDLELVPLRGNVDTRLGKLDARELDAAVLACAGLKRLGHAGRIACALPLTESLPAIGQGALAIECRADDEHIRRCLQPLDHPATATPVAAERAFLSRLSGSCQTPMAAHARLDGTALHLEGLVADPRGTLVLKESGRGPAADPAALGRSVAERLLVRGGRSDPRGGAPGVAHGRAIATPLASRRGARCLGDPPL